MLTQQPIKLQGEFTIKAYRALRAIPQDRVIPFAKLLQRGYIAKNPCIVRKNKNLVVNVGGAIIIHDLASYVTSGGSVSINAADVVNISENINLVVQVIGAGNATSRAVVQKGLLLRLFN